MQKHGKENQAEDVMDEDPEDEGEPKTKRLRNQRYTYMRFCSFGFRLNSMLIRPPKLLISIMQMYPTTITSSHSVSGGFAIKSQVAQATIASSILLMHHIYL